MRRRKIEQPVEPDVFVHPDFAAHQPDEGLQVSFAVQRARSVAHNAAIAASIAGPAVVVMADATPAAADSVDYPESATDQSRPADYLLENNAQLNFVTDTGRPVTVSIEHYDDIKNGESSRETEIFVAMPEQTEAMRRQELSYRQGVSPAFAGTNTVLTDAQAHSVSIDEFDEYEDAMVVERQQDIAGSRVPPTAPPTNLYEPLDPTPNTPVPPTSPTPTPTIPAPGQPPIQVLDTRSYNTAQTSAVSLTDGYDGVSGEHATAPKTPSVELPRPVYTGEIMGRNEVALVNQAAARIDAGALRDSTHDIGDLHQAMIAMDRALRPIDATRPSDMPDEFIKLYRYHEAPDLQVRFMVAERTADIELHGPSSTVAAVLAAAEIFDQMVHEPQYQEHAGCVLRVRDLLSPNPFHGTHEAGGGNVDLSASCSLEVTMYSDGPLFDYQFSDNYDRDFTADFIQRIDNLRIDGEPAFTQIVISDMILEREVDPVTQMNVGIGKWHEDHAHADTDNGIVTVTYDIDPSQIRWNMEQDLWIGGRAVDISQEDFWAEHGAFIMHLEQYGMPMGARAFAFSGQSYAQFPQSMTTQSSIVPVEVQQNIASALGQYQRPIPAEHQDSYYLDLANPQPPAESAEFIPIGYRPYAPVAVSPVQQPVSQPLDQPPAGPAGNIEDLTDSDNSEVDRSANGPLWRATTEYDPVAAAERTALLVDTGYLGSDFYYSHFVNGEPVTYEAALQVSRDLIERGWDWDYADQYLHHLSPEQWVAALWADGSIPAEDWAEVLTIIHFESRGYLQIVGDLDPKFDHKALCGGQISEIHGYDNTELISSPAACVRAMSLVRDQAILARGYEYRLQPWTTHAFGLPSDPNFDEYQRIYTESVQAIRNFEQFIQTNQI